jgi:hypothetical protein
VFLLSIRVLLGSLLEVRLADLAPLVDMHARVVQLYLSFAAQARYQVQTRLYAFGMEHQLAMPELILLMPILVD